MSEQTSFQLDYTGEQVNERLGKAGEAVLYTEQSLDFAKKAQARENIGATAIHIGNDEPTDENVTLWLDMDEESGGTESGGSSAAILYTEQTLTEEQKAQARANIGVATETATYYTNLSTAIIDINNGASDSATTDISAAKVEVFTADNGRLTVRLLDNVTESVKFTVDKDLDLVLNGKTLSLKSNPDTSYMIKFAEGTNCTIDGRIEGSAVVVDDVINLDSALRVFDIYSKSFYVLGGTYNGKIDGDIGCNYFVSRDSCGKFSMTNSSINLEHINATLANPNDTHYARALYFFGDNVTLENCSISVLTQAFWADAVITAKKVNVINCDISAVSTQNDARGINIYASSDVTIDNSKIFTDATGDTANSEEAIAIGVVVTSFATLRCYNSEVVGTHSGIQSSGNLYVSGGTYNGYSHGGFYFVHSTDNEAYINDAIIQVGMYTGQFTDIYPGSAVNPLAGFYYGNADGTALNSKVYMDGCLIQGKGDEYFVVRHANSNNVNELYISNTTCEVECDKDIPIRLNGSYQGQIASQRAKMYIGDGCNFTPSMTTNPDCAEETGLLYRRVEDTAAVNGKDYNAFIELFDNIDTALDSIIAIQETLIGGDS